MMDFMDSLRRGVDRAGYELDRLLRANRVRSQMNGLRSQMDEEIKQIGESVMDLYRSGESLHDDLRERCERVTQYEESIREKEQELASIEQETDGGSYDEAQQTESTAEISCFLCGASLPAGAQFCLKCGARQEAQPETRQQARPEPQAQAPQEQTQPQAGAEPGDEGRP
jgi:ribosomal protein L40E